MTSILTIFDEREVEDGWPKRIEETFGQLPNARFEHTSAYGAAQLLKSKEPRIVILGSRVLERSTNFIPSLKPRHKTILLSGDLGNRVFLDQLQQHGILGVPILDKVNFYREVNGILEGLSNHHRNGKSESKE